MYSVFLYEDDSFTGFSSLQVNQLDQFDPVAYKNSVDPFTQLVGRDLLVFNSGMNIGEIEGYNYLLWWRNANKACEETSHGHRGNFKPLWSAENGAAPVRVSDLYMLDALTNGVFYMHDGEEKTIIAHNLRIFKAEYLELLDGILEGELYCVQVA